MGCVTAVLGRSGEVGEGTSPGVAVVSRAPGKGMKDPSRGVLGSRGCPGALQSWGRMVCLNFPRESALLAASPAPTTKGFGFSFTASVISASLSLCLTCFG